MCDFDYVVPIKSVVFDIQELYPILTELTGLDSDEIFETLYDNTHNGSLTYICKEDAETKFDESQNTQCVYEALNDLISRGKLPDSFYIYVWW